MSWTIKWTKQAREDYANILSFTESTYGTDTAIKLLDKVEKTILRIQQFPFIFPFSKKLNGHRAVITKQISVIYFVGDTEVFITQFRDNRME